MVGLPARYGRSLRTCRYGRSLRTVAEDVSLRTVAEERNPAARFPQERPDRRVAGHVLSQCGVINPSAAPRRPSGQGQSPRLARGNVTSSSSPYMLLPPRLSGPGAVAPTVFSRRTRPGLSPAPADTPNRNPGRVSTLRTRRAPRLLRVLRTDPAREHDCHFSRPAALRHTSRVLRPPTAAFGDGARPTRAAQPSFRLTLPPRRPQASQPYYPAETGRNPRQPPKFPPAGSRASTLPGNIRLR